ncbi:S-(hydroxymethyl)mycothiol dehydrogenase [Staphylococcus chromogenes]|nr:S-(hydroxymethyl)mycothiol dehydrogenase [Staphylococcus chromogenes]
MSETVAGIVAKEKGAPVERVGIVIPDPGAHDVVVKIQACGVCHTDLAYREGDIEDAFPFLLGHEAAGIVDRVGDEVTHVKEGDFVVLNWRAVCGECRACKKGEPKYCFATHNASKKMTLEDGTELTPALGIGAFAEKTLVHEGQCTKVNPDEDPAVAGLLGCGVMAGLGAAVNTGEIKRGESVAVFGVGGVGMAAIAGAKLAGATTIIAVDFSDEKLELAKQFGATHTLNSSNATGEGEDNSTVAEIRELTGGFGVDVAIDAVGIPQTWTQAFYARDLAGRVVMVGVPNQTSRIEIPAIDVFGRGGSLKSSWYGDCLPERDFPMYVDLHLQGQFPLGDFVSERVGLDDVEEAFNTMKTGKVLRSVVVL